MWQCAHLQNYSRLWGQSLYNGQITSGLSSLSPFFEKLTVHMTVDLIISVVNHEVINMFMVSCILLLCTHA